MHIRPRMNPGFLFGGGGTGFQFIDHMHYACYCLHTSIPTNKYTTHTIIHVNMKYSRWLYSSVIIYTQKFSNILKTLTKNLCHWFGVVPVSYLDMPLILIIFCSPISINSGQESVVTATDSPMQQRSVQLPKRWTQDTKNGERWEKRWMT